VTDDSGVRIVNGQFVFTVTLDRPRALNALHIRMVRAIEVCISNADMPVVIHSEHPKVFCSGGDIRAIHAHSLKGEHEAITEFFATEYAMNLLISQSTLPVASVVDGLCLGGGFGIAGHSRVHVVTERASIAMPESAIGFFPDVGTSHLLANTPGAIGEYLGLTGARIGASDARYCGLATHGLSSENVEAFMAGAKESGLAVALDRYTNTAEVEVCDLAAHRADIDRCFSGETVVGIIERVVDTKNDWGAATLAHLLAAAPQSLEVALSQIRLARGQTLEQCLESDLAVAETMSRSADFLEGVSAKLIQKNRQPHWSSQLASPGTQP
jgi:enoyl-CoA hydratase